MAFVLSTPFTIRTRQRNLSRKAKPESGSLDTGACLLRKNIGKPCMGKPYARFDEGALGYPLSAVVRSRRVRRNVREQLQVNTSALLYPLQAAFLLIRKPPVSLITPVTEWPLTGGSLLPIVNNEQRFLRAAFISKHFEYRSGEVAGASGCLDFGQLAFRFLLEGCRSVQQCTLYNWMIANRDQRRSIKVENPT